MQLLEKGIHVIQEQPIHSEEYKKCLIIAKKNHCKYQLNTFYPYLDSVRKFISIAIRLRKAMPITYIIAESSVQVLFPLLDILNQILGGVQPYKLEKLQGENVQRFSIFNWLIKKCPVTLIVDNQMDVAAPESNLVMFHRITLGTPKGTLMLTDTHGGVLWTPVFHEDLKKQDKLEYDEIFQIETQEYVNDQPIGNLGDIVTERWPNCMEYVLRNGKLY